MPTNSSGVFTLPASTWVETGDTVLPEQHNPPFKDLEQGMTDRLMRDGRAPMTGNLAMGLNRITNLAPGTAATDAVNKGQVDAALNSATIVRTSGDQTIGGKKTFTDPPEIRGGVAELRFQDIDTPAETWKIHVNTSAIQFLRNAGGTDTSFLALRAGTNGWIGIASLPFAIRGSSISLDAPTNLGGELDVNGNAITNLPAPSGSNDAARKSYVDARTGAAGNGLTGGNGTAIAMGAPSTIGISTGNATTTTSHTHALNLSGRSVETGEGLVGGGNLGSNLTLSLAMHTVPFTSAAFDRVYVRNTAGGNQMQANLFTLISSLPTGALGEKVSQITAAAVGSLAMAFWTAASGSLSFGATVAGSVLEPCAADTGRGSYGAFSGTWRCLGFVSTGSASQRVSLFQRVA